MFCILLSIRAEESFYSFWLFLVDLLFIFLVSHLKKWLYCLPYSLNSKNSWVYSLLAEYNPFHYKWVYWSMGRWGDKSGIILMASYIKNTSSTWTSKRGIEWIQKDLSCFVTNYPLIVVPESSICQTSKNKKILAFVNAHTEGSSKRHVW